MRFRFTEPRSLGGKGKVAAHGQFATSSQRRITHCSDRLFREVPELHHRIEVGAQDRLPFRASLGR